MATLGLLHRASLPDRDFSTLERSNGFRSERTVKLLNQTKEEIQSIRKKLSHIVSVSSSLKLLKHRVANSVY